MAISCSSISAIIITRGDHDLGPLMDALEPVQFGELIVKRASSVYDRYRTIFESADLEYIYVQDDDCLIDAAKLASKSHPDDVTVNMPAAYRPGYVNTGISLVGFGAIFHKRMVNFTSYLDHYPHDELFTRECDRVFTYLNRGRTGWVDIGVQHLPYAYGATRMYREDRHGPDLEEIKRRLYSLNAVENLTV